MKHWTIVVHATVLVVIASCGGDPIGPVVLAEVYALESADGVNLPVYSFRSFSNTAGSCNYDLMSGSLMFHGGRNYSFSLRHRVLCVGNPASTSAYDDSSGTYTRSGDELTLDPRAQGTFSLRRVRLTTGVATVDVRMNAGDEYRLRFVEGQGPLSSR